jgi:hypothetical protein
MNSKDVILADVSDEFVCATWKQVLIYVFHTKVSLALVRRVAVVHDALKKKYPQTISIGISLANVGLPDAETRKYSSDTIKQGAADDVLSGLVLVAQGMLAAAARALITGIFMVSGSGRKNKVFGIPEECAAWVAPLARERIDAKELAEAIKLVRATRPRNAAILGPLA